MTQFTLLIAEHLNLPGKICADSCVVSCTENSNLSPRGWVQQIWSSSSELMLSDVIQVFFDLIIKKKETIGTILVLYGSTYCISCVASDQFLFSTTPLRFHLALFMNSLNWMNVFGQRFHVHSGCHRSCWFGCWNNGYDFHHLGKEKWNANTLLSQDLRTQKKSALSNAISEMWDELNRTKCTSGGMVWSYCCQTVKADPTGSRVDPQAQNRTYTTWQMFLITFFKQIKSYSMYSCTSHVAYTPTKFPLKTLPEFRTLALNSLL